MWTSLKMQWWSMEQARLMPGLIDAHGHAVYTRKPWVGKGLMGTKQWILTLTFGQ